MGVFENIKGPALQERRRKGRKSENKPRLRMAEQKADRPLDPIVVTKKECHLKYYLEEQHQDKLSTKPSLNNIDYIHKSFEEYMKSLQNKSMSEEKHQRHRMYEKDVFQKYSPELILPEIKNSAYLSEGKRVTRRKRRLSKADQSQNQRVFRYNTPWNEEEEEREEEAMMLGGKQSKLG